MTPRPAQERHSLFSIQVLRAVAALAVTAAHISGYEFARQYGLPDALPRFEFGAAGVDLFFVISGFVMVYASEPLFARPGAPREFFLRRLARIVPLYWLTTTVILVYLLAQYRDLATAQFSPAAVAASYLFIPYPQLNGYMAPVHGVGWTLNYEMFFYACFCGALVFSRVKGVLILSGLFVALVIFNSFMPLPIPLGYWATPIILEFVYGMLIGLVFRTGLRLPAWASGALIVAAIFALGGSRGWLDGPAVETWGLPFAAVVAAVALAGSSATPGPLGRALCFLGDASYSLYLIHPIAITLPRRLFPRVIDPAAWPWTYAGLLLAVAVAAAVAVHLLLERPVTRSLQRRIARRFHGASSRPLPGEMKPIGSGEAQIGT